MDQPVRLMLASRVHFCSEVLAHAQSSLYPGHGPALLQRGSGRWKKVGLFSVVTRFASAVCCHLACLRLVLLHAGRLHYVAGCGMDVRLLALNTDALPHLCVSVVSRFCKCCLLSAVTLHVCDCSFARRQARLCGWVWNWLLVWLGLKPLAEFMCDVELETEVVPVAESWHSALQESCDITGVCSWKPQPLCREVRVVS